MKSFFVTKIDYFNCENGVLILTEHPVSYSEYFALANYDRNNFDGLISNLIDSSKKTYWVCTDKKTGNREVKVIFISKEDKDLVKYGLSLCVKGEKMSLLERTCYGSMSQCLGYGDLENQHAFNILRIFFESSIQFSKDLYVSKEFHTFLEEVLSGNDFDNEGGFENKYFVRFRNAADDEIKYLDKVVSAYPNDINILLKYSQEDMFQEKVNEYNERMKKLGIETY